KQSYKPPLSRVNTLGSKEYSMQLMELIELCTKLSDRVLALENNKNAQDLEITHLKKRVKRLKKKKKSRTPQLKRRLFKVKIESSAEKNLDDLEDSSKQGRKITEIDQDLGISLVQHDAEIQGRYGHDIEINTASTSITTASINITIVEPVTTVSALITTADVSISTAEPSTPPTTKTTIIKDKDLTISQTLMKMRSGKSKEKAKERGSKEKSSETATRQTRGVIMREASEITTRPTVAPQQKLNPKDKDKGKMAESETVQTKTKLQQEQERLSFEAALRGYSFDKIKTLFETTMRRVNTFVSIESEVDRAVPELAARSSKRDAEEELDQGRSKRQKTGESSELAKEQEIKKLMNCHKKSYKK
nr:hypothetical protein [Tanacetum cinerariifolium]